jgi:hypothetical protein
LILFALSASGTFAADTSSAPISRNNGGLDQLIPSKVPVRMPRALPEKLKANVVLRDFSTQPLKREVGIFTDRLIVKFADANRVRLSSGMLTVEGRTTPELGTVSRIVASYAPGAFWRALNAEPERTSAWLANAQATSFQTLADLNNYMVLMFREP